MLDLNYLHSASGFQHLYILSDHSSSYRGKLCVFKICIAMVEVAGFLVLKSSNPLNMAPLNARVCPLLIF